MRIVFSLTAESKGIHIQRPILNNRKSLPPLPRESSFFFVSGSRDGVCMTEKGLACWGYERPKFEMQTRLLKNVLMEHAQ